MRKNKIAAQSSEFSILAVDDDEIMTLTLQAYFQSAGYRIDIENNPERAIERVREGNYDILLLDFLMSPICGDQVVARIREFDQDLYIILLTGHKSMAPPIKTIRELEIQGYYEKSDRFDQLELLVESCVKSIRQMRTIKRYRDGLRGMIEYNPKIYQLQSLDSLFSTALSGALGYLKAATGFIYLPTENGGMGYGTGIYQNNLVAMKKEWEEFLEAEGKESGLKKRVFLPGDEGGPIGVLAADLVKPCGKESAQLFSLYARQISAAIGNARMHLLINEKKDELDTAYGLLNTSYLQMVEVIRNVVDARDFYTRGHSDRVSYLAVRIAKEMGKGQEYLERIRISGLFHDIGKIGVPDEILLKEGRLTEEEYTAIKEHAERGANMLKGIKFFEELCPIIRGHHERIDGKGYPDGRKGNDIPEEARIIAVADAFDAMTSHRKYRADLTLEQAKNELLQGKGTQFDGEVVDAFMKVLEDYDSLCREMKAFCEKKTISWDDWKQEESR